ncbi:MBL fold metallo-hydrolase [Sphingomonas azotifigens]|uniref:MBL fold metallo-hydrolase n=1 Tax=Sphingomonas azotifigens TaxID=330920 RepID=UPI000A03BF67|nr:MBL fold metallo-hydrolase [Sphingomonas azotifigens]
MNAPIRVRMYQGLLGDCFLITIGDPAASRDQRVHILIDCGVLQQVPGEAKRMRGVAENLFATTEGRLDLVVITHEHWDHISGFKHARDLLIDKMQIDTLWLAWTERRGDGQADPLRKKSERAKKTVSRAAGRAAAAGVDVTSSIERFNGPLALGGGLSSTDIIPELIARAEKTGTVKYLEPGEIHVTPGEHGLRAYVLGPSRNPDYLTRSQPPGVGKQTYLTVDFAAALDERYAAAESLEEALDPDGPSPFANLHAIPASAVEEGADGAAARWLWSRYRAPGNDWRNIDHAWLSAAGSLALKLDNDTNNTSLVLAFEVAPGGDVLLFAADAQVGNWMSWHLQNYPAPEAGSTVSATELLGRTVLYKVGHHASHNATLDKLGLALMTHPGLVAMIPVVESEARRTKNGKAVHRGWDMPYPDLLARLMTRTEGRILRGDAEPGKDPTGKTICSDAGFLQRVRSEALFVELTI